MLHIGTVFSGIGAPEHALWRLGVPHEIIFACDNGDVTIFHKTDQSKTGTELLREAEAQAQALPASDEVDMLLDQIRPLAGSETPIRKNRDLRQRFSLLFEKIGTLAFLESLRGYSAADRKKAVDDLYAPCMRRNKVRQSYLANYAVSPKDYHWNIALMDGRPYAGKVDLYVGGSPCQSFSLAGRRRGFADTRGTLFHEYIRILKEVQPTAFIYENVRAVTTHDSGRTWQIMSSAFDSAGYDWSFRVLNAKDYGIPQSRERLFAVGIRHGAAHTPYQFPEPVPLETTMRDFLVDSVSGYDYLLRKGALFVTDPVRLQKKFTQINGDVALCQKKAQQYNWHGDFVFREEDEAKAEVVRDLDRYFLSEKVRRYVLSTGSGCYCVRPEVDQDVAHSLLKSMHKMHRAGIDNYVTTEGRIRKLTPRECLRLMGFTDDFRIVVSDTAMYQQAGNSIVVNVLMALIRQLFSACPALAEAAETDALFLCDQETEERNV